MKAQLRVLIATFLVGVPSPYLLHGQVRLSNEEAQKRIIAQINPVYSKYAKEAKIQGTVRMEIVVSEKGDVVSRNIISGHPFLVQAAMDAAKEAKYAPLIMEEKPVPFITTVAIEFSLGIPKDEYEREEKLADSYFKESHICQEQLRAKDWKGAGTSCKKTVLLADKLGKDRQLEKMMAYRHLGMYHVSQSSFSEALECFNRALAYGKERLEEDSVDMGYAFESIGVANQGLGNLGKRHENVIKKPRISSPKQ